MSKPIGMTGLKRIANDKQNSMVFKADAAATKTLALDPSKTYAVFAMGAGPATLTFAATSDSADAIANGTAKYVANRLFTALAAAGGYLGTLGVGATGIKVTHVKSGAGVDDAPTVALLGGRYEVRIVEAADNTTGFGDYTAVTPS